MKAALAAIILLAASIPAHAQMYWRLDTGLSKTMAADFRDKNSAGNGVICMDLSPASCSTPATLDDVGSSAILGAGVGYRFDANFRGDVTFGYRGGYALSGSDGNGTFKSDVTSAVVMANGYYDFRASGVTPYAGAGIGWAQNTMSQIVQTLNFFPGSTTTPGGKTSGVAYALMAGVAIPFSGWILDIGYRYIDLGKIEGDAGNGTVTGPGFASTFPYSGAEGRLKANELTIGVRF